MFSIKNKVEIEIIINKSRFISTLLPVFSEENAKEELLKIQLKYKDATHNCYCYIVGDTANVLKFSDDGEPTGTAGVVIYDVLQKNSLTNVLCVVTRYFGGIKLGAGGLVRAYSSSTARAVDLINKVPIYEQIEVALNFDYTYLNIIENRLENYEITEKEFLNDVYIKLKMPKDEFEDLEDNLKNITKNTITIKTIVI